MCAACGAAATALVLAASMRTAAAQSAPAPAVRVARDLRFHSAVWPADLNRDGITDLVSSTRTTFGSDGRPIPGQIQVALGNGDGTFAAPVPSAFRGYVVGVGDFNGDRKIDVIASSIDLGSGSDVVILPGTGTATLGAAVPVATTFVESRVFALTGDLDGDGRRDLVIPNNSSGAVLVFPGNGDFTFDAPATLTAGVDPTDGILGDFNGDGRTDLAVTSNGNWIVSIFLNRGSLLFTGANIAMAHPPTDVTTADVNGDGKLDLFVSAGRPDAFSNNGEGFVEVLPGNGDGTFRTPAEYAVPKGPMQIVVGDFNRDGVIDIVTGNRSTEYVDDCGSTLKTWDSVTILPGLGGGGFGAGSSFSLGDQAAVDPSNAEGDRYRNSLISLNTSDLNGDRATDLIASWGGIVFNNPATPNRAPTVIANDTVIYNTSEVVLRFGASDPDNDFLAWEVRDDTGRVIATYPNPCGTFLHEGDNRFTFTVDDGHGHRVGKTVVYTRATSSGSNDVGAVGASGSDDFNGTSGTVRGSGADIWGTADEFHYAWLRGFGTDFDMTVRVASVQNVHPWTKAGLMIRESLDPGSRHVSVFITPGHGVAFQRRTATGGTSLTTPGPAITAPVWLKLSSRGDVITAYVRKERTDLWTAVGHETLPNLSADRFEGLAVTSHSDGTIASASFTDFERSQGVAFTGTAIGGGTGSLTSDGVIATVTGRGTDIWGTADAFFYANQSWSGDVTITARVRSVGNTHVWAKAGVMVRESLAAGSRHAMTIVTPGKGVAQQYRASTSGTSAQNGPVPGAAPAWVRIVRRGNIFTSAWSKDGVTWTTLGAVTVVMSNQVWIGLPVTSHDAGATTTAVFDDVTVSF